MHTNSSEQVRDFRTLDDTCVILSLLTHLHASRQKKLLRPCVDVAQLKKNLLFTADSRNYLPVKTHKKDKIVWRWRPLLTDDGRTNCHFYALLVLVAAILLPPTTNAQHKHTMLVTFTNLNWHCIEKKVRSYLTLAYLDYY